MGGNRTLGRLANSVVSSPSPDRLASLLRCEQTLLGEIFGTDNFNVDDLHPDEAVVRCAAFELEFAYDRTRWRDVTTFVTLLGVPEELSLKTPLDVWARFNGKEPPRPATNAEGIVTLPADEQLRSGLEWVAQFVREVLSDPRRKRDAAYFAYGYHKAYNDWASGRGSWSGSD
jgi:hypothetical protein